MTRNRTVFAALTVALLGAVPIAHAVDLSPGVGTGREPLVVDLTGYDDRTTVVEPAALSGPEQAVDVGPGTHLLITIPAEDADDEETLLGCTANFVWASGGTQYLGAAGHCFIDPDAQATATHGPGADYDASGVVVRACVSDCTNGGVTGFAITGETVELGRVAYARQSSGEDQLGFDFGVVEIPADVPVRPAMPVFRGPTHEGDLRVGDLVCLYGNGVGVGEIWPTMGRTGVGVFEDDGLFLFEGPASPGDSGAAVQTCDAGSEDGLTGDAAIGVLTHLTNLGVAGTTVERAVELAGQADLRLSLVLGDGTVVSVEGEGDGDNGNGGQGPRDRRGRP